MELIENLLYLLMLLAILTSEKGRAIIYFLCWPVRLPVMAIGYAGLYLSYAWLKIFNPEHTDLLTSALADDGKSGNFYYRIYNSWQCSFTGELDALYFRMTGIRLAAFCASVILETTDDEMEQRLATIAPYLTSAKKNEES